MSHAESKLIVRFLRRAKKVLNETFPLDYFYKMEVADVVAECQRKQIKVTQLEVLEATRRVIAIA